MQKEVRANDVYFDLMCILGGLPDKMGGWGYEKLK